MNIPKSFMLAGQNITVVLIPDLYEKRNIVGEALYFQQKIILDTGSCSQEQVEQNFLHELMHWIFFVMNEDKLRNDEKIVDVIAHFLHQMHKTTKND